MYYSDNEQNTSWWAECKLRWLASAKQSKYCKMWANGIAHGRPLPDMMKATHAHVLHKAQCTCTFVNDLLLDTGNGLRILQLHTQFIRTPILSRKSIRTLWTVTHSTMLFHYRYTARAKEETQACESTLLEPSQKQFGAESPLLSHSYTLMSAWICWPFVRSEWQKSLAVCQRLIINRA